MSDQGLQSLLAAILDRQLETGAHGEIPEDRLRQAMTVGPGLSEAEKAIMLLSPVAREDWQRVKKDLLLEIRQDWQQRQLEVNLLPLAAASDSRQLKYDSRDFTVKLYRYGPDGLDWIILLQLSDKLRSALPAMCSLRLMDSGGLEWARGQPDTAGELTVIFSDPAIDLGDRARQFTLRVEPC